MKSRFYAISLFVALAIAMAGSVGDVLAAPLRQPQSHTADLIISEYIDGEGTQANDKVIEIFNGTQSFRNLDSYYLEVYSSDNDNSGSPRRLQLSDVATAIDPGQTIVIVKENPSSETLQTWHQWEGLLFDGNDVVILRNEGSAQNQVIDSIGQLGSLPSNGTDWRGIDENGRDVSTRNQGLRRRPDVCAGRVEASNPFDPALEWTPHPSQDFSDLGKHAVQCAPPVINEFVFRHIGPNDHEYIEVNAPGNTYNAYTVLVVNGNAGTNVGTIYRAYQILDTDVPNNGYWTTGFLVDEIDDGSNTILLTRNFTGTIGDDIDSDNDGTIDYAPWSQIVDDVAVSLMRSGDRAYSSVVMTPNFDGIPAPPGGASRIPDSQDTDSVGDWVRNHFVGEGLGCADCRSGATADEAVNTPGQPNRRGTSVASPTPDPVTPMVTPHPPGMPESPPKNCVDIIVNGGFEQNHEGWKFGDVPVPPRFVSDQQTEGMRSVLLGNPPEAGSRNVVSFSSIRQLVTIPPNATVAFITWDHMSQTQEEVTPNPGSHADRQDMIILAPDQTPMAIKYRARMNEMAWQSERKELTEFVGKSFYVYFNAFNDGNGQRTWMYLDNVKLMVCYSPGVMMPPSKMPSSKMPPPEMPPPAGTPTPTSTSTATVTSTADIATSTPTATSTADIATTTPTSTSTADIATSTPTSTPTTEATPTPTETPTEDIDPTSTNTSTPTGTSTSTPAVEVTPTATGTATETVAGIGGCIELVVNGNFEITGVGWTISSEEEQSGYTSEIPNDNSRQSMRVADLEGSALPSISTVEQVVSLPPDYDRYILDFQYYLAADPEPGPGDLQYVDIYNQLTEQFEDRVLSAQRDDQRWAYEQADLTHLAGEEIRLRFAVNNDGVAGRSAMYVDNVRLRACGFIGEGDATAVPTQQVDSTPTQTATATPDDSSSNQGPTPSSTWQNRLGALAVLAGILVVIALLVWGILYALRPPSLF